MILRIVTGFYVACLVAIIWVADRGTLDHYVTFYKAIPWGDKVGHFGLMGMLSLLVNTLLKGRILRVANRPWQVGTLLVFACVLAEECSQAFLPHRTFSLLDLASDLAGIWLFGWLARVSNSHGKDARAPGGI